MHEGDITTAYRKSPSWPKIVNLRQDPYERYMDQSQMYLRWMADKMWTMVPAQTIVRAHLESLKEFPPTKGSSLSVDKVLQQMQTQEVRDSNVSSATKVAERVESQLGRWRNRAVMSDAQPPFGWRTKIACALFVVSIGWPVVIPILPLLGVSAAGTAVLSGVMASGGRNPVDRRRSCRR